MLRLICAAVGLLQIGALGCGDQAGVGGGDIVYVPGPTCIAFCAQVIDACNALVDFEGFGDVDEEACQQLCERDLASERAVLEACGDAVEAVFECASALDCQGVNDWVQQEPPDAFPCRTEVTTVDTVCFFFELRRAKTREPQPAGLAGFNLWEPGSSR